MRYKHKITGAVIDTECEISGKHWEKEEGEVKASLEKPAVKKGRKVKADG